MKAHLLYADRDPVTKEDPSSTQADLVRDLGLDTLFDQMAAGDDFLRTVASRTILDSLTDLDAIQWRQDVLDDWLKHEEAARRLYDLAVAGLTSQRQVRGWFMNQYPSSTLHHAVDKLQALIEPLADLRRFADQHHGTFRSQGVGDLVETVRANLSDEYFDTVSDHLRRLRFPTGVVLTAELGPWCQGTNYVLRKPASIKRTWRDFFGLSRPDEYTWRLPDRDEAGGRALSELRDRGINLVANAMAQSTDHILSFLGMLRWEMGFYVGCLNVHDALRARGLGTVLPEPSAPEVRALTARGLYEVCLGLRLGNDVVGNALDADGASLVMITGANQGGKSTLLRAIGLAQLMMQSGMFVAADCYRASVAGALHSHFAREEDAHMEHGKLDEELARMSDLVDRIKAGDLLLLNESFSSTNEREGSRIGRDLVEALTGAGIRVAYVTHLFDLADTLFSSGGKDAVFLRPQRLADGRRTFKVVPGAPAATSHGEDLYEKVFGNR